MRANKISQRALRLSRRKRILGKDKRRVRKFKTSILVRAYCHDFWVTLKRDHFCKIPEALEYVHKYITNTGMVKGVIHFSSLGELYVPNEDFVSPEITTFKK